MAEARPAPPLRVFLSYSHKDDELCERFLVHLSQLRRQGLIETWHDRRITAGAEWAGAIDEHLNAAHIIILLVSADFLASDYCNDVEMTLAIERGQKGEARLVPVILEPCDWETSRFASFQALPKDGKPVVDWRTNDHGFNNAVKGLRRLIIELCGPTPVRTLVFQMALRRHPWRWAAGFALAALLAGASWLWSTGQSYLKQGTDLLNVGRYADARPVLQRAKLLNPFSRMAACALEVAELDAIRSGLEQRLSEAEHEYPGCAYLKVLSGETKYARGDRRGALADYREAVIREPRLAEAHFDVGRVLDLDGNPDSALKEYQTAATLSRGTPRYHNNLADLYFRREEYDKAIEEYGQMGQFPLAALEMAKIYRLQGRLEEAAGREEDAVRWLKDPALQSAEQQNAWAFEVSPVQQVRLGPIAEKQCYADLELALTRFLRGDENQAARAAPAAFERCSSRRPELSDILRWELRRLGIQTPNLCERCDAFAQRFLAAGK